MEMFGVGLWVPMCFLLYKQQLETQTIEETACPATPSNNRCRASGWSVILRWPVLRSLETQIIIKETACQCLDPEL